MHSIWSEEAGETGRWKFQEEETSHAKTQRQGNNQQRGKSRTQIKAEMIARGGRERKFQNTAPSGPRRPDSKLGI